MKTQQEQEGKYVRISVSPDRATGWRQEQHGGHRLRWSRLWEIVPALLGFIWLVVAFFPILYMFMTSLRPQVNFFTDVPWLPPSHPTLGNYQYVLQSDFEKNEKILQKSRTLNLRIGS